MREIIIWGAGKQGMTIARKLRQGIIKYFVDSNPDKVGRYLCGLEVKDIDNLYKEKKNVLLVKTIQDEIVNDVVKRWGGMSIGYKELLISPEIAGFIDEDLYTKYKYDKSLTEYLMIEKLDNWYRTDYVDKTNQQLIYAMKTGNQRVVRNIFEHVYSGGEKFEDEYYNVRPAMRLANNIIQSMDKDKKIVDFACGHGELITQLAKDGYCTWALDYSEDRIRCLLAEGINASVQNVEQTDYSDAFFDVVICMECLEHVRNVVKAVAEISRVLIKQGIVIVTVPYMKNCESRMHVRQFDEVKLVSLFNKDFEIMNMIKVPYLNWTDDNNLFLVARKL